MALSLSEVNDWAMRSASVMSRAARSGLVAATGLGGKLLRLGSGLAGIGLAERAGVPAVPALSYSLSPVSAQR